MSGQSGKQSRTKKANEAGCAGAIIQIDSDGLTEF